TPRPAVAFQRSPHHSAAANSTTPPSGRTPVRSATAKPAASDSAATGQVGVTVMPGRLAGRAREPLREREPVAGVVAQQRLDPVRPLRRRLPELDAPGAQLLVGGAAVVDEQHPA